LIVPPVATPFHPLENVAGVRAAFVPRIPGVDVETDRENALARLAQPQADFLAARGFSAADLATAEQVHGAGVVAVTAPGRQPQADGLITNVRGLVLGIYVADCAAVYLADRRGRAVGLVHSGRAGTAANITGCAIALLRELYGVAADDLVVEVSPCIRPPLYENDFAAEIAAQARAAGAAEVRDRGICTGRELGQYYSYRVERGRTGRMLAVLALES
jgi:copper oxidase (laccase) domain-containing protein